MDAKRKIALLAVTAIAFTAIVGVTFTAAASSESSTFFGRFFNNWPFGHMWGNPPANPPQGGSSSLTIDAAKAKAIVDAAIPGFKVGTVVSSRTGWIVPIEDNKGVVVSIEVTNISASTAEEAIQLVQASLAKGWKVGDPTLMRTIFSVPLLDSANAKIGYISVNGVSGEIVTRPSTIMTVTSDGAETLVSDAIKEFQVGNAKDRGTIWVVGVNYKGKVVMTVTLGKLNTPTSSDAVNAVKDSLSRGWAPGDPKKLGFTYSVPIVDTNGNTIGGVNVDGRTGSITYLMSMLGSTAHMTAPQRNTGSST